MRRHATPLWESGQASGHDLGFTKRQEGARPRIPSEERQPAILGRYESDRSGMAGNECRGGLMSGTTEIWHTSFEPLRIMKGRTDEHADRGRVRMLRPEFGTVAEDSQVAIENRRSVNGRQPGDRGSLAFRPAEHGTREAA